MSLSNPFCEWKRCATLRQNDIDGFLSAGIDIISLVQSYDGSGLAVARDRIVAHPEKRRFEFSRFSRGAFLDISAFILVALDREGEIADLVAFRGGENAFAGSWLGRIGLLGEEQLDRARDELRVHADVLSWLRAGRQGVVVIDPVRAAPMLRDAGSMVVGSWEEKRRLADMLSVRLPPIAVEATVPTARVGVA
ncbi:hypothetical protein D3273_23980 [Lichenibacterium minor]|uniref:Uncharacterized protein n=1 Tax=Lichenibacterium minor TaxID=2316528 RepID=A0A4Q2U034_9HYPH|nr:hypothetical protein [Lichenibacterium minor]RYC29410.1 hypothetical protein D3273_23980 [Lichenibacterium minor]